MRKTCKWGGMGRLIEGLKKTYAYLKKNIDIRENRRMFVRG